MQGVNERNGKHSEFEVVIKEKKNPDDNILSYFKSWLTELDIFFVSKIKRLIFGQIKIDKIMSKLCGE